MVNQIKNRYLVSDQNVAYCADFTQLHDEAFLFLLMDLGSRLVIGHRLLPHRFSTQEVVETLTIALIPRKQNKAVIFHTDNDSVFTSQQMLAFAETHHIILSTTNEDKHANQPAESLNRTIKLYLRAILLQDLGYTQKRAKLKTLLKLITFDALCDFTKQAIERYNTKPHTGTRMFNISPIDMDEALWSKSTRTNDPQDETSLVAYLAPNDNSDKAIQIATIKANIIQNYAGDWAQYFLEWRQESRQQFQDLAKKNELLLIQNRRLYELNQTMEKQIEFLVQSEKERQAQELAQKQRKLMRSQARKQPLREVVTPQEFIEMLDIAKSSFSHSLVKARTCVAIALLYLSGLRISNLLLLRRIDLINLIQDGQTDLPLIKGGPQRNLLFIGTKGKDILNTLNQECAQLITNQPDSNAPIFVTELEKQHPISKRNFNDQINRVLVKASAIFNKHLRSHSFRATLVTDLLENNVPIEKVREIMGHRSIGTTATYKRSRLKTPEYKAVISKVNSERTRGFKTKLRDHSYRIRKNRKTKVPKRNGGAPSGKQS